MQSASVTIYFVICSNSIKWEKLLCTFNNEIMRTNTEYYSHTLIHSNTRYNLNWTCDSCLSRSVSVCVRQRWSRVQCSKRRCAIKLNFDSNVSGDLNFCFFLLLVYVQMSLLRTYLRVDFFIVYISIIKSNANRFMAFAYTQHDCQSQIYIPFAYAREKKLNFILLGSENASPLIRT